MHDLLFLAIGLPIGLLAAAVGRTVMLGPQHNVEKATTKWFLNVLLLLILFALLAGLALLRQSMNGPPTAFDIIEGEALPPAY